MDKKLQEIIKRLIFLSPFIFPTYFFRFQVAGIPLTVLEVFSYVLFGLWLLYIIIRPRELVWDKQTRMYWYVAFALLIGATLGVIFAPDILPLPLGETLAAKRTALGAWKGWIFAPILYFAVLTQMLKTRSEAERLMRMYIYSAAFVGLLSYVLGLFGNGITYDFRLSGFYESANYLALYLVPAIPISIYFYIKRRYPLKTHDYLNLSSLSILVYCLFFTKSYAGIIGVFGSIGLAVFYLLFKNPKLRKKMGIALTALILTFIVVIVSQLNSPKFKQALDFENRSSSSVRLEIYATSWDLVKKNPIFGHGPGLFQANYQDQVKETLGRFPLEWNMPHPHNIFLGFWMNAGIIGLIAFLMLIVLCHRKFTFPLLALWAILVHGMFDMPFWKNDLAMIFWLVIACILVMQKAKHAK